MIQMAVESPEQLWVALGSSFLYPKGRPKYMIDYGSNQRWYSLHNTLKVNNWPKGWTNPLMYDIVGYISAGGNGGTKSTVIRSTYLHEEKWAEFKNELEVRGLRNGRAKIAHLGINFNMLPAGKGGCLSSFHICQHDGEVDIVIHMKIAEVPKKFLADLEFMSSLITELDLPQKSYRVTFMLSSLYFSLVGLRSYVPVLGLNNINNHGLDLEKRLTIQEPTQVKIYKARERLIKQFGKSIMDKGLGIEPYKVLEGYRG